VSDNVVRVFGMVSILYRASIDIIKNIPAVQHWKQTVPRPPQRFRGIPINLHPYPISETNLSRACECAARARFKQTNAKAAMSVSRDPKVCQSCGRKITWRKKWERCWEEIKYCSDKCRRSKPGDTGKELENMILDLLAQRKEGATICPSEVARKCFGEDAWREQMETVRQAARRLVADGQIEITQKGQVVDPSRAKGPIRLRLL
jgi:hypothetical protein